MGLLFMDKATNPIEWIKQAKAELDVAEHLNSAYYPKPLEIICFHAQQVAEKSVKAVLLKQANGTSIRKTHDISQLLDNVDINECPFEEKFYDYADELFPYGVVTRYPVQLQDDIDEYRLKRAMRFANEIWSWANRFVCGDTAENSQEKNK